MADVNGDDAATPEPFFEDVPDPFAPPPVGEPTVPVPPPPPGFGGWYPPPPGAAGHPAYPRPQSTNGFAIAALVCGIAGLFTYGVVGLLGVVFGVVALRRIPRDGQGGRNLAIAGIVVGAVSAALGLAVLAYVLGAIPAGLPRVG